mgnify:FL=1
MYGESSPGPTPPGGAISGWTVSGSRAVWKKFHRRWPPLTHPRRKGVWYALRLRVPETLRGQELHLVFGGASADCRVYVNGKEAGKRTAEKDNWRGPFSIRIDQALSGQAEDTLIVFAAARSGFGALYSPVWLAAQPKAK